MQITQKYGKDTALGVKTWQRVCMLYQKQHDSKRHENLHST